MVELTKEEQVLKNISAMRDSVWVINSEIEKDVTKSTLETIQRNVSHLELMMSNSDIIDSGEDLTDITQAIDSGKTFYEENESILTLN